MNGYHEVKQGETLSRLADRYHLGDYRVIYNHPKNADFKRRRPNPDVIFPGDQVFIPEPTIREQAGSTDCRHRFRLRKPQNMLRIAIEDAAGERLRNAAYEITFELVKLTGSTNGDGMLEQRIPLHIEEAILKIGDLNWTLKIGHLNPMEDAPDDGNSGIQARLRNLGYDLDNIDGILGARTRAAIRAFQQDNPPLAVDGICGPQTRAKLLEKH